MNNPLTELAQRFDAQDLQIRQLTESLNTRALELENVGWSLISGYQQEDDGLDIESLKTLSEKLRELAATNPWHVRGAQLRHAYVFGRGMNYVDIKPGAEKVINDPHNKAVLFSVDAYEAANMSCFTDGQFIVLRDTRTNRFTQVPIHEVHGAITDPDDVSAIRYIKRVWNSNGVEKQVWYPLARFKNAPGTKIQRTVTNGGVSTPVSQTHVVYIKHTKRQTGWVWGVPDSLAAMIWTLAYSGYLQDNTKLVHALSQFAWNMTRQTSAGVDKAAAQISVPGVGGTHVSGPGGDLASVGVPSAQVNMNNGQPLIAAVAASFGVPVIELLSSPGATGGSYGAASTLTDPTITGFGAVQDSWAAFYEEILHDLGSKNATAEFPSISADAVYRQITSLASMVELGILWREEAREAALDLLDVKKSRNELPPEPEKTGTVVSKQGVSATGVTGATTNPGGDSNHDGDASA